MKGKCDRSGRISRPRDNSFPFLERHLRRAVSPVHLQNPAESADVQRVETREAGCGYCPSKIKRTLNCIICVLLSFAIVGCNDAKQFAAETREGYKMVEEVAGQVSKMVASLDTNDLAKAREIASKIEHVLSTRVLSWYFRILAAEETEGTDAAKALIADLKKTENIDATEAKALAEMEKYFQSKHGRTGDFLFLICAIAAEQKYGHGAGELFVRIASRYRKFPQSLATNAVASSLTNEFPAPITR